MSAEVCDPIVDAIDGAEEVRDPLEGLVQQTASDPGAPFAPQTLQQLGALKRMTVRASRHYAPNSKPPVAVLANSMQP